MKVATTFRSFLLVAMLLVVGATGALAQQGRSATVSGFGIHASTFGAGIQYAIDPSIQIFGTLSFITGDADTRWAFEPWLKFLLEGPVNPIFYAGLEINSMSTTNPLTDESVSTTALAIDAGAGLQYYVNRNFGAFVIVQVISVGLSDAPNDQKNFGIFGGHVGVEYYLPD